MLVATKRLCMTSINECSIHESRQSCAEAEWVAQLQSKYALS